MSVAQDPDRLEGAVPRYEQLAGFITGLVESGTLRPGMRAPSLRRFAEQHRASMSTALHAYQVLEDRGILEARPRSGYFVALKGRISLSRPGRSNPPDRAAPVAVSRDVLELLENAARRDIVPLGCAIPNADLLSAGRLDRFLARLARTRGADFNVYTEIRGDPGLREELARRAIRWGQAIMPDDIAITCGCTEALSLALRAVTTKGDVVAIESPTYFGLLQVLEANGLKALELPTDADHGLDTESLDRALAGTRAAACLLSSSFNNPLGNWMDEDRKRAILAIPARHGVPLIEDDIYGDIHFTPDRPRPICAVDPKADVTYCSSFSKTIAPGYRVGWVVSPQHIGPVLDQKFAQTLCGPALPQAALADFLRTGGYDSHLRRLRREFADHIDRMTRAVETYFPAGTRVTRPAGGFVLWLELPGEVDTRTLYRQALEHGICFAPGDMFSASKAYSSCLRLSCGEAWSPRIEQAIARIGALARTMTEAVKA